MRRYRPNPVERRRVQQLNTLLDLTGSERVTTRFCALPLARYP